MAYIKLSEDTDTGEGFITHDDWKTLSFEGYDTIYKVIGSEEAVNDWVERVKGTVMKEADALTALKVWQLNGIENEKIMIQSRLAELEADKILLMGVV